MVDRIAVYEKNYFFFVICIFNAKAATIQDYEIQSLIKEYLNLIQLSDNYSKKINFHIILDDNPNAFINENELLFVTTGLIKYCPTFEGLIGVLAHEVGHLKNFHVTKRINSIQNLRSLNKFGTLSIIASSILSNNSNNLIQPIIINQVGIQNYYSSFSREQEREADIYASQILNKLNISSKHLMNFLKILENKSIKEGLDNDDFKFSSHPVYKERFEIIENVSIKNSYSFNENSNHNFNMIKAKLFGFTEKNSDGLKEYLDEDYLDYANSIILSRNGELKKSLSIINKLLKKYPSNFFLIETKADLLLSHGYTNIANKFYKLILEKEESNFYVKKRIFEIEFHQIKENKTKINKDFLYSFSDLILIFRKDNILQEKFKELYVNQNNIGWQNLVDANIYINNKHNDKALKLLDNIVVSSNDKKLVYYAKQLIKQIEL
tara:strand:+ start:199 stop:1509 length:1311 start_codon:yes stop_codon:yes gene_type:complete